MTALFAVGVLARPGFLFTHTAAELAPHEDQGILFALIKAPQYANLDYTDVYGDAARQGFRSFPETETRFVVNGTRGRPEQRHRRHDPEAVGRAHAQRPGSCSPLVQAELTTITGAERLRVLAAAAAGLDRRPAGPDGDQLARRLRDRLQA